MAGESTLGITSELSKAVGFICNLYETILGWYPPFDQSPHGSRCVSSRCVWPLHSFGLNVTSLFFSWFLKALCFIGEESRWDQAECPWQRKQDLLRKSEYKPHCVCVGEGAKIALLRSCWTVRICSLGPSFMLTFLHLGRFSQDPLCSFSWLDDQ